MALRRATLRVRGVGVEKKASSQALATWMEKFQVSGAPGSLPPSSPVASSMGREWREVGAGVGVGPTAGGWWGAGGARVWRCAGLWGGWGVGRGGARGRAGGGGGPRGVGRGAAARERTVMSVAAEGRVRK